jgi:thiamine-phosphate diphosphorylase
VKPVICMVTDRRRAGVDALVWRVAAAARAGVDLVQIRERDLEAGPLTRLVEACVDAVRNTRTRILVNDRLDVARAAGAHGVHLRGDSMSAARVRAVSPPGFLIGRSIHSLQEAAPAAGEAAPDYLLFGTVFPTTSKPDAPAAGPDALRAVVRATTIPVLAIGGVTSETAATVARTHAAGVAAIGLFADVVDQTSMHRVVAAMQQAFDTSAGGSYHSQ